MSKPNAKPKLKYFTTGKRVQTIYGPGTVGRVLMSGGGFEAWVRLDIMPAIEHRSFEPPDERTHDVRCYADECTEL